MSGYDDERPDPRSYQDWLAEEAELEQIDEPELARLELAEDPMCDPRPLLLLTSGERQLIVVALSLLGAIRLGAGNPAGAVRCTMLARRIGDG